VLSAAENLASRFHDLKGHMATIANDANGQMIIQVNQVNALTQSIARLNQDIVALESGGGLANDLRDQREESVKQLSRLIDVRVSEGANGAMNVLIAGQLVVGSKQAYKLSASKNDEGIVELKLAGHDKTLAPRKGSLAGLVEVARDLSPNYAAELDALARNLIFELNRTHSTGVPAGGPFHTLKSANALQDQDGDGRVVDEAIGAAGLDFPVVSGELYVNVTDEATGIATTTRIEVDAERTTVGELIGELNAIAHLSASVDGNGHVSLSTQDGYGFDFSRRIYNHPDSSGTLGGKSATLVGTGEGPFALVDGDTIDVTTSSGTFTITLNANEFADISNVTAAELAEVISSDPVAISNGLRAVTVGDRIALQTTAEGTSATLTTNGGTALAKLGINFPQTVTGQAHGVDVHVTGSYSGDSNHTYTFKPNMNGTIGVTAGLKIDVYDQNGARVRSLDVGAGYVPGTDLPFAHGLSASFELGDVSLSANHALEFHATADSDTSDVLAALGLNAFFTGTNASDIELSAELAADSSLLATSATGLSGDNGALRDLASVEARELSTLGGATPASFFANLVSGIGSESAASQSIRDTENVVLDGLVARREQLSGVNVDEELINMTRFQQAYQAAAQFIQVVNQINEDLLRIV
jgi:flagellar hook-associated protein FlgK